MQVRKIGSGTLPPPQPVQKSTRVLPPRRPLLFGIDTLVPSSDAEALSQHLYYLSTPTFAQDDAGQVHLMPPPPGKPNPESVQIEEYANLERLQEMIERANKAVTCLAVSGTSVEIKKLYKRLKADYTARKWFLFNRNAAVVASVATWNESKTKRSFASLASPFILCKQVEKQLEAYASATEALKGLLTK